MIVHRAAFFKGRTFHIFALALHDVADLLLLRIGQVQAFKHHVMLTRLMMHHHRLAVARRGGGFGGVCQLAAPRARVEATNSAVSFFIIQSLLYVILTARCRVDEINFYDVNRQLVEQE